MAVDKAYRRGTLLGLTIAEIFILLIFLLLLALLGLTSHWQEKNQELHARELQHEKDLHMLRARELQREKDLSKWDDIIRSRTPKEIKTLQSRVNHYEDLIGKDPRRVTTELAELRTTTESLHKENQAIRAEHKQLRGDNKILSEQMNTLSEERDTLREQARIENQTLHQKKQALHETNQDLRRAETELAELREATKSLRTENQAIRTEREQLRSDNKILSEQTNTLSEERDTLREQARIENQTLHQKKQALHETNQDLRRAETELAELRKATKSLRTENQAIRTEREQLRSDNKILSEQTNTLSEERDALREQARIEKKNADEATAELNILRTKGENPPCWYKTVAAGEGKTREKAYYLFDIAVYDNTIIVRHRQSPPGRAEDDSDRLYADEAGDLDLDRIPYDTPLTDTQLIKYMQPIHDLGKAGAVRSYSCIFSVKVWDKTSPHAKARWKHAHDKILEALFGTYSVRDDPWPESEKSPKRPTVRKDDRKLPVLP